jgi:hypothetical protein
VFLFYTSARGQGQAKMTRAMEKRTLRAGISRAICIVFIASLVLLFPANALAAFRDVVRVAVDPTDSNTVYAASNQGIFKSLDAAQSWFEINAGLPPHPPVEELDPSFTATLDVRALALDPNVPQTLYAGIVPAYIRLVDGRFIEVPGGIFKSIDGGEKWSLFGEQGDQFAPLEIAVDPVDPNTIDAAAGFFIKTTTGGSDWLTRRVDAPAGSILLDPQNSNTIYLGLSGGDLVEHGVVKSINGGKDWLRSDFPRGRASAPALAVDPQSPDTIYATFFQSGGNTGTYQSTNAGESWSQLTPFGTYCVSVDQTNPNILYVCERYGIAKSTDRGMTWYLYQTGLETVLQLHSLAIDPNDSSTLYAAAFGITESASTAYKSTDGGESWIEVGP